MQENKEAENSPRLDQNWRLRSQLFGRMSSKNASPAKCGPQYGEL